MSVAAQELPPTIVLPPRSYSAADVMRYASLTDDHNPIHTDEDFARDSAFGVRIVHGTLLVAQLWAALRTHFGDAAFRGCHADSRFFVPIAVGATVFTRGTLLDHAASDVRYEFITSTSDCSMNVRTLVSLATPVAPQGET